MAAGGGGASGQKRMARRPTTKTIDEVTRLDGARYTHAIFRVVAGFNVTAMDESAVERGQS